MSAPTEAQPDARHVIALDICRRRLSVTGVDLSKYEPLTPDALDYIRAGNAIAALAAAGLSITPTDPPAHLRRMTWDLTVYAKKLADRSGPDTYEHHMAVWIIESLRLLNERYSRVPAGEEPDQETET